MPVGKALLDDAVLVPSDGVLEGLSVLKLALGYRKHTEIER